jgi:hypothetical protein
MGGKELLPAVLTAFGRTVETVSWPRVSHDTTSLKRGANEIREFQCYDLRTSAEALGNQIRSLAV